MPREREPKLRSTRTNQQHRKYNVDSVRVEDLCLLSLCVFPVFCTPRLIFGGWYGRNEGSIAFVALVVLRRLVVARQQSCSLADLVVQRHCSVERYNNGPEVGVNEDAFNVLYKHDKIGEKVSTQGLDEICFLVACEMSRMTAITRATIPAFSLPK